MSPRTGRPPKEDSRENQYRLRMSNDELHKLEVCCQKTGLSKAEVIRQGIELVYKKYQNNKRNGATPTKAHTVSLYQEAKTT